VLDRLFHFIESERLFTKDDQVLVGLSGGPDSTCLLHALVTLGFKCVAAHLHHGQRPEAEQEVKFCQRLAVSLGVPFMSGRADVPLIAKELRVGLEEAGREARYDFFERAASQTGCNRIAVAHTIDDQLETVLLNLTRGTGMTGLRGIPVRRDDIVRPMLAVSKLEALAYCEHRELSFLTDPANADIVFSRARIRHRVTPELRRINPAVAQAVHRMTKIVGEEDDFLNGMAAAALEQSEHVGNPGLAFLTRHLELILHRDIISTLPPVLFKRAVQLASKTLGSPLDYKLLSQFASQIATTEKGALTSPGGIVHMDWNSKYIGLRRSEPLPPFRETFEFPGSVESDRLGWNLTGRIQRYSPEPNTRRSRNIQISLKKIRRPLYFRSSLPGDRMQPIGFIGHRKLSDLCAESGLSIEARRRLPIVCDFLGPFWAPGVCMDSRTNPDPDESEVLALHFASTEAIQP
jgi:tRNA(Ile)-lysidine synthase